MSDHQKNADLISEHLGREDLTAEEVLTLTIARRLNECGEDSFAKALNGGTARRAR